MEADRASEPQHGVKVLVAEDDEVSRRMITVALTALRYDAVVTCDGDEAWRVLQAADAPSLALLDWNMPGPTGPELCRRLRETPHPIQPYVILLTGRDRTEDIVEALRAGANDYITKPFHHDELNARILVGVRMLALQRALAQRVAELEEALGQVKHLQGLLPICSYCKKVRDDQNYWHEVETYVSRHAEVKFSHAICPACWETTAKAELEKARELARVRERERLDRREDRF